MAATKEIIMNGEYLGYMKEVWLCGRRGMLIDYPAENGKYRVEITFGGPGGAAVRQVLAFPGRRLLGAVTVEPGGGQTFRFALDVRFGRVQLFVEGELPGVVSYQATRDDAIRTIYLMGDSTVCDQEQSPYHAGWGELLPVLFDEHVCVSNHARCGYSTQSFIRDELFGPIRERLLPGDLVMMQFAHNDQKEGTDRYAPAYGAYTNTLRYWCRKVLAAGATPVLVTAQPRRRFDESGHIINSLGDYPEAARRLAAEDGIPLIDLNRKATALLEKYGPEDSKALFAWVAPGVTELFPEGNEDNTHFSYRGALEMAQLVVEGMREIGLDVVKHVR